MKTITTRARRVWALLTIAGRKDGVGKSAYRLGLIGLGILALGVLAALHPVAISFAQAVSFGSATNYPVAAGGWNPHSVAVGDVNGDGKLDLAVADNNGNTPGVVSIFLGKGDGSFEAATNFPAQTGPISVALGKLNSDNILDLAVVNLTSWSVSILFGNGDGSFTAAVNYNVGAFPISVAIGDLNGDGKADLAVANQGSGNVSILINNGTGSFSAAPNLPVGTNPRSVALGDLNGDGLLDIAVANTTSHDVSILLQTSPGLFSDATNFAAASGPFAVAIGDLNADNKPDLAIVNDNDTNANVAILLNMGAGAFGAPTYFGSAILPSAVAISDFNSDGTPDLAVTSYFNNLVSILRGTGAGAFGSPANFAVGSGPHSVAVGDFNRDTRPDLAVANYWSGNVSILLNTCSQCTRPTISPVSVTRQQGSPSANATIANVNDAEDDESLLTIKVNDGSSATVNGVTVSGISVNSAGVVTANVIADCGAANASFTLKASDPGGLSTTATLQVAVNANTPPTLGTYPNASVNSSGTTTVTPSTTPSDDGSINSITALALGFTGSIGVNQTTGVVTISNAGPPGNYTVTVMATDDCSASSQQTFTLSVLNSCGIMVNPASMPSASLGVPFAQTLSASPAGSYTFSLSAGALPPGLQLVNVLGIYSLRGKPTARGTYNFTLKAKKNNTTCESIRNYTMTIP